MDQLRTERPRIRVSIIHKFRIVSTFRNELTCAIITRMSCPHPDPEMPRLISRPNVAIRRAAPFVMLTGLRSHGDVRRALYWVIPRDRLRDHSYWVSQVPPIP